jgi:molybdenum cofactor cytidylyltransferase
VTAEEGALAKNPPASSQHDIDRSELVAGEDSVSAIVLAAGCARRVGRQKLLLPINDRPLVRWVTDSAIASSAQETIVVIGCEAEHVREALSGLDVRIVFNSAYADGLSTSLRAGISAVDPACRGALFLLGDQPFVSAATIDRFITAFVEARCMVVRGSLGGRPANPALMSSALFPELLAEKGDVGGRRVAQRYVKETCLIELDANAAMDIDCLDDYEIARSIA